MVIDTLSAVYGIVTPIAAPGTILTGVTAYCLCPPSQFTSTSSISFSVQRDDSAKLARLRAEFGITETEAGNVLDVSCVQYIVL